MKTDNEIIAEFMNRAKEADIYSHTDENGVHIYESYYRYRKSWDWLMPVVEKIQSIKDSPGLHSGSTYLVTIKGGGCGIVADGITDVVKYSWKRGNTTIENVYSTVVVFIKWYNQSKEV
jgi:hypothetical protein